MFALSRRESMAALTIFCLCWASIFYHNVVEGRFALKVVTWAGGWNPSDPVIPFTELSTDMVVGVIIVTGIQSAIVMFLIGCIYRLFKWVASVLWQNG